MSLFSQPATDKRLTNLTVENSVVADTGVFRNLTAGRITANVIETRFESVIADVVADSLTVGDITYPNMAPDTNSLLEFLPDGMTRFVNSNLTNAAIKNIVIVQKNPGPGQYLTIEEGLDAAADLSPTVNSIVVLLIGPGEYNLTSTRVVPPFVYLSSFSLSSVRITAASPAASPLFVLSNLNNISNLDLVPDSAGVALDIINGEGIEFIDNTNFIARSSNTSIAIRIVQDGNSLSNYNIKMFNCEFRGFQQSIFVDTSGAATKTLIDIITCEFCHDNPTVVNNDVEVIGNSMELKIFNCIFLGRNIATTVNAINVKNSAAVKISSVSIENYNNAIVGSASAELILSDLTVRNIGNKDVLVLDSTVSGFISSNSEFNKLEIPTGAMFRIINFSIKNEITVGISGAQFTSVSEALAFINLDPPTATNPMTLKIGPGTYQVSTITMMPYLSIIGNGREQTILECTNSTLFDLAGSCHIEDISMTATTPASTTFMNYEGDATELLTFIEGCAFGPCAKILNCNDNNGIVYLSFDNCNISNDAAFDEGFDISASAANRVGISVSQFFGISEGWGSTYIFQVAGPGILVVNGVNFLSTSPVPTLIRLSNGAFLNLNSSFTDNFDNIISIPAGGSGPVLNVTGCVFNNVNSLIVDVNNSGTAGGVQIQGDASKINLGGATNLLILASDTTSGAIQIAGNLTIGSSITNRVEVTPFLEKSTALGIINGGALTIDALLTVDVSAGRGYLFNATDEIANLISWQATSVSCTASSQTYIYVSDTDTVVTSTILPNRQENVLLGSAVSDATQVLFILADYRETERQSSNIYDTLEDAFGGLFQSTISIADNGADDIAIGGGTMYFGTNVFSVISGAPISFRTLYGSKIISSSTTSTVEFVNYDNGGTLTALTAGFYTQHYLLAIGQNDNTTSYVLRLGTTEHAAQVDAEGAPPDQLLTGAVGIMAGIIVQQGTGLIDIINLTNQSGGGGGGGGAPTDHNTLLNLTVGDVHTQYLPVDGTRTMMGDLDMNANNVVSAGQYNGVTVEAHASRHVGGADPIPVATNISDGLFSSTDKTILDNATSSATSDTLVLRDGLADASFNAVGFFNSGNTLSLTTGTLSSNLTLTLPTANPLQGQLLFSNDATGTLGYKGGAGNIYVTNNATGQSIGTVFTIITQFDTDGVNYGTVAPDVANNAIIINDVGYFRVTFSAAVQGQNNRTVTFQLFWNNLPVPAGIVSRRFNSNNEIASVGFTTILQTTSTGQNVDLRAQYNTGTPNITVISGSLTITQS